MVLSAAALAAVVVPAADVRADAALAVADRVVLAAVPIVTRPVTNTRRKSSTCAA